MQNKKFLFSAMILAVLANIAIIGCNRQGSGDAKAADSVQGMHTAEVSVPDAKADSGVQQQNAPSPLNVPAEMKDHDAAKSSAAPQKNPYENAVIEIKTFQVDPPATGFGYNVIIDGHPYIHQYNIPGVPGNNGFSSEANAKKAGDLVAYKIRHNIMPPAVTANELDSIGVLK